MISEASILADTVFPNGARITTFIATFPRSILAEYNTHAMIRRNAASSRAIPATTMIRNIKENPFIPRFMTNKKGMQGKDFLKGKELEKAEQEWLTARDRAIELAEKLSDPVGLNIHKQHTNRLLEPWMFASIVTTATDWENFFAQRAHPSAEPHFQHLADQMQRLYRESVPRNDKWHLPFVTGFDIEVPTLEQVLECCFDAGLEYDKERYNDVLKDISVGRCAKVSYNNFSTGKVDVLNDIRLAVQLSSMCPGHWSPFEHVARMAYPVEMRYEIPQLNVINSELAGRHIIKPKDGELGYCGPYRGCYSYRRSFSNENIL